jgi:hypothetical protein
VTGVSFVTTIELIYHVCIINLRLATCAAGCHPILSTSDHVCMYVALYCVKQLRHHRPRHSENEHRDCGEERGGETDRITATHLRQVKRRPGILHRRSMERLTALLRHDIDQGIEPGGWAS